MWQSQTDAKEGTVIEDHVFVVPLLHLDVTYEDESESIASRSIELLWDMDDLVSFFATESESNVDEICQDIVNVLLQARVEAQAKRKTVVTIEEIKQSFQKQSKNNHN